MKIIGLAVAVVAVVTAQSNPLRADKPATFEAPPFVVPRVPAFPGAEGYGSMSVGGRGGRVIKVTNLDASGPGSLAEACAAEGPRIVVFDVSGVIPGPRKGGKIFIRHPHITIAGQTAPGAGITIEGYLSTQGMMNIHDVTVRFIRVRPRAGKGNNRTIEFNGGRNEAEHSRLIIDHVSTSWGADDTLSMSLCHNITAQWSIIGQSDIHLEGGDEPHNFGAMFGTYGHGNATMHHCLFAHHHDRTPLSGADPLDYRNNVLYNVATGLGTHPIRMNYRSPGKLFDINMVANYCKTGPGAIVGVRLYRPPFTMAAPTVGPVRSARAYVQDNYHDWQGGLASQTGPAENLAGEPFQTPPVATEPAEDAYERVLARAGCLPRDVVDKRLVHETRTGTGTWGRHEPDAGLMEGLSPGQPRPDADGDGMPDDWEIAHGLDPNDPADATRIVPRGASKGNRHAGFTYIEFYINELADNLAAEAMVNWRLADEPTKASDFGPASKLLTPIRPVDEIVAAILAQSNAAVKASADKYAYTRTDEAWYAIQMLSRMGLSAIAAVPPLKDALGGDDTRTVVFAAYGLGAIGPAARDATDQLIKVLQRDYGTPNSKWSFCPSGWAAWALGRIGPDAKAAVPALGEALTHKDQWAHAQAAWALSQMGPHAAEAIEQLGAALSANSLPVRRHARTAMVNIGPDAVPTLVKVLERGTASGEAAEAAGLLGPAAKPAIAALIKLAGNDAAQVRSAALVALAQIDPREAGEAITAGIADPQIMVRCNVIRAVGRIGDESVRFHPALAKALSDEAVAVRLAAVDSLSDSGNISELLKAVLSGDSMVRARSARALGRAKLPAAVVQSLVNAMDDKDAKVRFEAAVSLARIGGTEATARLRQALDDDDHMVRSAARIGSSSRPGNRP